MGDAVLVLCTCKGPTEATRIARALVEARLAACVNILPRVRSIYRWQGEVEKASEALLLVKTTRERFASLRDRVVELHSYDMPEIIAISIEQGLQKYLEWVGDQVAG